MATYAERNPLKKPHTKLALCRELATGEKSTAELAEKYGVVEGAIRKFKARNLQRIAEIQGKLEDEFAGLWIADQANRLAYYEAQANRLQNMLNDPDIDEAFKLKVIRAQQTALKSVAEERGHLKQVLEASGLKVTIDGVDMDKLQ